MHYIRTAIRQTQAARLLTRHWNATKENILGDGLKLCRRAKAFNSSNPYTAFIAVKTNKSNVRTVDMTDVAHCGNAHLCAYCSGVKAAHMRDWITEIFLPAIKSNNLLIGLLTLTAHHRRDCDWSKFVEKFYLALSEFRSSIKHDLKALGSLGRIRTMESPVGSNGLHIHIHDLFTYTPGVDVSTFEKVALKKWKAALKKFGLSCNGHGIDFQKDGDFDARYIAKEVAAHDTKTSSKSDLQTLFQLLDQSKLKSKQAGDDWIRAAKAIQGRDKWNVGQLANKLGIPSPSDWKKPQEPKLNEEPETLISYPQEQHMVATSPINNREGLALVLRAAFNEEKRTGSLNKMSACLCDETIKCGLDSIKNKHGSLLAYELAGATTQEEKDRILAVRTSLCNFELEDYELTMKNYLNPTPAPVQAFVPTPVMIPDLELDFS